MRLLCRDQWIPEGRCGPPVDYFLELYAGLSKYIAFEISQHGLSGLPGGFCLLGAESLGRGFNSRGRVLSSAWNSASSFWRVRRKTQIAYLFDVAWNDDRG